MARSVTLGLHRATGAEVLPAETSHRRFPPRRMDGPRDRGLSVSAYDTAWLAGVRDRRTGSALFPKCLDWLLTHQRTDGSWGGRIRYQHDRVLSTLAAVGSLAGAAPLAGVQRSLAAGTAYLWKHATADWQEPITPVGFELLLPALAARARQAGVNLPARWERYREERRHKLMLLPSNVLYSGRATIAHSLEFLGDEADPQGLRASQWSNGSVGNSPATTAFMYERTGDEAALSYLRETTIENAGQGVPMLHPCETFTLLWTAYHLFLGGVPAAACLSNEDAQDLARRLESGGISLSPSFPIPDADDTAVGLLLLHHLGKAVDANVLKPFAISTGHFASFPYERHSSPGVNIHVLHALIEVPGFANADPAIEHLLDYLNEQIVDDRYWFDKWHISPYYATSHAIAVLSRLPEELFPRAAHTVRVAKRWIRETMDARGRWGFWGIPTAEETAYAVLGLTSGRFGQRDVGLCQDAFAYLREIQEHPASCVPEMWVDKGLYAPPQVIRGAIDSACVAYRKALRQTA